MTKSIRTDMLCDILVVSKTRLDDSYNDNLFIINGYKFETNDKNTNGGGLTVFYMSDLPIRRLKFQYS